MVCVLTHPLYIRVVLSTPESHSRNSLAIPEVSQSRKVDQTLRTGTDGHNLKEDLGQRWVLATGAHDRAPVVEDPARLAGLPYWLAE